MAYNSRNTVTFRLLMQIEFSVTAKKNISLVTQLMNGIPHFSQASVSHTSL